MRRRHRGRSALGQTVELQRAEKARCLLRTLCALFLGCAGSRACAGRLAFADSASFWERKYKNRGENSGPGSYGEFGAAKAEFLNAFVREHAVETVTEFGCGDGYQLSLAKYPKYVGSDVSRKAIDLCRRRFENYRSKSFFFF